MVCAVVMGTTHVPVPVHGADHDSNVLFADGVAVSVTFVSNGKSTAHVPAVFAPVTLHVMPAGDDDTVPTPLPLDARVSFIGSRVNVALAVRLCVMERAHVSAVPVHDPPHVENCQPVAGAAVSVTDAPGVNGKSHTPLKTLTVSRQSNPLGVDLTVPDPVPLTVIDD
jgi:hypothetical protein